LTDAEFEIIKEHPKTGYIITSKINFLKNASRIILEHHEKVNGSGYPYGKKAKDILQESKILAIADIFDALTSDRVYRKAFPLQYAIKYLQNNIYIYFDAELVDIFILEKEQIKNIMKNDNLNIKLI
jgi:HD-GYP domain-containing protein (c-di-GMP phosphodiesterase class II)